MCHLPWQSKPARKLRRAHAARCLHGLAPAPARAQDGLRRAQLTGALPADQGPQAERRQGHGGGPAPQRGRSADPPGVGAGVRPPAGPRPQIGRAAGRGRGENLVGGGSFKKKKKLSVGLTFLITTDELVSQVSGYNLTHTSSNHLCITPRHPSALQKEWIRRFRWSVGYAVH